MKPPPAQSRATYIFKLEGPLDTLEKVQDAAGMSELPVSIEGIGEGGEAIFCRVDGYVKHTIIKWTSAQQIKFKPTFVRVSQAEKNLSQPWVWIRLSHRAVLPIITRFSTHHRINIQSGISSTAHSVTAQFCLVNYPFQRTSPLNWSLRAFPEE
jgi:hypothetical protein